MILNIIHFSAIIHYQHNTIPFSTINMTQDSELAITFEIFFSLVRNQTTPFYCCQLLNYSEKCFQFLKLQREKKVSFLF